LALFGITAVAQVHNNAYLYFLIWQVYFFIGLTLSRFRLAILAKFNSLNRLMQRGLTYSLVGLGSCLLLISLIAGYSTAIISSAVMPGFIKSAANYLASRQEGLNFWLANGRTGLLRPAIAVLTLTTLYIVYQKYKQTILTYSGKFVMAFGRNSLQIFVLQAIAIPLVSALPLRRDNMYLNAGLSGALVFTMWLLTHKFSPVPVIRSAFASCYASLVNNSYLVLSNLRDIKNRLATQELD
jgi:hypothetical protein